MNKKTIISLTALLVAAASGFAQNMPAIPALTISAKRGKNFSITLDSNKTTGYSWQLQPIDASLVRFLHTKYSKNRSRRLGAPGKETWTFKALDRGTATIRLLYLRPGETDAPPARIVTVTVLIQ